MAIFARLLKTLLPSNAKENSNDLVGSFDSPDGFLYVNGLEIKHLDPGTGTIQTLLTTDRQALGVLRDGSGQLLFEARTVTPEGRSTIQPFTLSSGTLVPCLPPDESMRSGIAVVKGIPTYVRKTEWRGAFGSSPWDGEGTLCQIVDGEERVVAARLRRTATTEGATTHRTLLPYHYYADTKNGPYALAVIETTTAITRELGRFRSVHHPSLSSDETKIAFCEWRGPKGRWIVEIDVVTREPLAEYQTEGRPIGVMYAPDGQLYILESEAYSGRAELKRLDNNRFEHIATLT
jgi:hypothetical protein